MLLERQRAFREAVYGAADGAGLAKGPLADAGLRVYRNNVFSSLIASLRATYPAVEALVGEAFFRAAASEFIRAEPPAHGVLVDYGGGLGGFLETFPPAASLAYLGDVARLEWAEIEARNAADATPMTAEDFAALPEDRLAEARLALHPSARLIASAHPVVAIHQAALSGDEAALGAVDLDRPEAALVIRPHLDVEIRAVSPGAHAFLASLARDATLGEAAQAGLAVEGDLDVSAALAGAIAGSFFTGARL